MKTLIYGAGPIGRWLSLRLHDAGADVTLLDCVPRPRSAAPNSREVTS